MEDYVLKLQQDLRKRLDRLCLMYNEPALHVVEYFAELRRQVDFDAEMLLNEIQSEKCETGKATKDSDVNGKRLEFIRILKELEKRTGHQPKPQVFSSEVYSSLEHRVDAFKDSLVDVEDSYVQLAREIVAETDRVEERLLGEQTIIYWPHQDENELGSLVYLGDIFTKRQDIDQLVLDKRQKKSTRHFQAYSHPLLIQAKEPHEISKSKQVFRSLFYNCTLKKCARASKFFYIGKTKEEYSGYSAEESSVDREFVSYQDDRLPIELTVDENTRLNASANLFDVYPSSTDCKLFITNYRLESLHVILLPTLATRLTRLRLIKVHLESFDPKLLSQFTNLNELKMQTTFSKNVRFDLEFLKPLKELVKLELTLPNSPKNLSAFMSLTNLKSLKLEGLSDFSCVEKLPELCTAALKQILSAPRLESLELSCIDVVESRRCHIGCAIENTGVAEIDYLRDMRDLYLTGNSITDLPIEILKEMRYLGRLRLDKNLIRHVNSCNFGMLGTLKLDDNPIESIEPNAFARLYHLTELSLAGCRLESIDNEMFNGLLCLRGLNLSANLIERIEVVAENGRRINVAKASLSDKEKKLVKKRLFKCWSRLNWLDLSGNKLKELDLNCFSNMKKLSQLDLSLNKMSELSGEAGPELLFDLSKLFLNDNQLTAIDKSALPKRLEILCLSRNQLKRLDDDFFNEFTRLYVVYLNENELSWTITENTFASCNGILMYIDASQNKSIKLTEGAIVHMPKTRYSEYDLSENLVKLPVFSRFRIRRLTPAVIRALQQIPDTPESFINRLVACCVSNCSIKSLARNPAWQNNQETQETDHFSLSWLAKVSQLNELDFSGNLIETLDHPELFADFKLIEKIILSGNRLSRIHRDTFKGLFKLRYIVLSGNSLSSIDTGLFRELKSLGYLDLSSNGISFLNLARLFRTCPNLISLNLADNQLDERSTAELNDARTSFCISKLVLANNRLSEMSFVRDMTRLKNLDLRNNRIETAMSQEGENLLVRLRELTHLDLSGNKISHLTDEMLTHFRGQLKYLNLSNNLNDFSQVK